MVLHRFHDFNAIVALWQTTILCGRTVGQQVGHKQDIMSVSMDCLVGVKVLIFHPFKFHFSGTACSYLKQMEDFVPRANTRRRYARVSQLAESRPSKSDVAGSIPVSCSISEDLRHKVFLFSNQGMIIHLASFLAYEVPIYMFSMPPVPVRLRPPRRMVRCRLTVRTAAS